MQSNLHDYVHPLVSYVDFPSCGDSILFFFYIKDALLYILHLKRQELKQRGGFRIYRFGAAVGY